jgi:putative ABC transport system permease protein
MPYLKYAIILIVRNKRRTLTYLFGLVLAVGLFSGILFFVDASAHKMTQAAIAPVVVDMQARSTLAQPNMGPVREMLVNESFVTQVEPIIIADFTSLSLPVSNQATSAGKLFILEPSYYDGFGALHILSGQATYAGVLISQAAANELGLSIGDSIAVNFDQLTTPYITEVSGVVDPTDAYFLFAATDPAHEGEYNPAPYDLFITPDLWEADLAIPLTNPPAPTTIDVKPIPAQKPLYELHIGIDHTLLPSDPTQANIYVTTLRRQMEKQFPGEIKIANNLADSLKQAQNDVLWAKLLFLFLGMPGVALAAYLSKYATDLLTGPQRREIGLLRARGAAPNQIMLTMTITSILIALVGTVLGVLAGLGTTGVLMGPEAVSPSALAQYTRSIIYAFGAGLILTGTATFIPIRATLKREISQERRFAEHTAATPFWARAYLDIVSLVIAGVIFWITRNGGGFTPGGGSEGTNLSLGFFVFLGPFFLWVGLTLLLNRVMAGGVSRGAGVIQQTLRRIFGDLGLMAGRSITRRAPQIASAVIIVSLALSFGVSLGIFINTYQVQKAVDARFELGSDIKLTTASTQQQTATFVQEITKVPGVTAVTPVENMQAYVGANLETVFGIDPNSYTMVTELTDSFFVDTSAAQAMQNLAQVPNGVLVSDELAKAYDILPDDPVIIRLPRTLPGNANAEVPMVETRFQAVGVIRFFPTSKQDAFLVMNQSFMQSVTQNDKINYFLIRTDDAPHAVATRIQETLGTQISMKTDDIDTAILASSNSLTSLNLQGLGSIEQGYSVIIISLGLAIFLLAMIYERAKEFGAMRAVGGALSQIGRILWSETLTVGVLSVIIGSTIGLVLGRVFVSLLKVLYTIPPKGMIIPWGSLFGLLGLILAGMTVATLFANRRLARMDIAEVLREL